ncbi:MAG: hypothetical protein ACRDK7_06805 [Solirubrobacteraceae bacterium]
MSPPPGPVPRPTTEAFSDRPCSQPVVFDADGLGELMRIRNWSAPLLAVALLGAVPGSVASAAPTALPPALRVLEQKMSELRLSSERFTIEMSISGLKLSHGETKLFKLLGAGGQSISGEVTASPFAGNVQFELFGQQFNERVVDKTDYLYFAKLAAHDGGRPWIKLGAGGLGELFRVNGKPVKGGQAEPSPIPSVDPTPNPGSNLGTDPFAALIARINGASSVRELGPATVDGQAVTRFIGVLDPSTLEKPTKIGLKVRRKLEKLRRRLRLRALATPKRSATLEVSIAANGLPVQMALSETTGKVTTTATGDVLAINFPLVIEAPPANQTIDLAQLRKLEKQSKKRHHAKPGKRRHAKRK